MKRITIGGIGNVLSGDDGVGPYLVRMLDAQYSFGPEVQVVDFGTPGLDFVVHIANLDALLLVDAVDNDKPAGSVTVYTKDDIMAGPMPMRLDPHQPALKESLWVADVDGSAPREVKLVGITGEQYKFGKKLTPAVRAAVSDAIQILLGELDALGVAYSKKESPQIENLWWETLEENTEIA